jgi:PPP family 3-phenylpropionic acid transporter
MRLPIPGRNSFPWTTVGRVWGSIAFVIGSAATGKLVSEFDYRAVLAMLTLGVASMLLGMLLRPSILPQGDTRHQDATGWKAWRDWS